MTDPDPPHGAAQGTRLATLTHLIGVDGGGSGCRAVLADLDGRVVATASGGPANLTSDFDGAIANVGSALDALLARAGLPETARATMAAHMGLAGAIGDDLARRAEPAFGLGRCHVSEDRITALAGALGPRDGALIALGTGTIIGARRGDSLRFVNGWGLKVSDQASGGWLSRSLLERVLLCHDGLAEPSDLTRATLARFGGTPQGLVRFATGAGAHDLAELAPDVIGAALQGDPHGVALMREGAAYLDQALRVLPLAHDGILCLAGGVGPHYAPYLHADWQARLTPPKGSPIDGALGLARETWGPSRAEENFR